MDASNLTPEVVASLVALAKSKQLSDQMKAENPKLLTMPVRPLFRRFIASFGRSSLAEEEQYRRVIEIDTLKHNDSIQ